MLYKSKSREWHSLDVLGVLVPDMLHLPAADREESEQFLWEDLCSEYDAENLCIELERLSAQGQFYSPEFWSFEKVWRRDEFNHYIGFQRLYHLVYGTPESAIAARLQARPADFTPFLDFLTDEFKLCLMLAYDELCTTRAYAVDMPYYRAFGQPLVEEWMHKVRGDEAIHYMNALRVVQTRHRDRLPQAEAILEEALALDLQAKSYQATFLFDHGGPSYSPAMLRGCAETVMAQVRKVM